MTYSTSITLLGASAGSAEAFLELARERGAQRIDALREYLVEIYRLASAAGIRAEIAVVQSWHETADPDTGAPWTSKWWRERLNPAGIGITGTPSQDDKSRVFPSGESAARAQLVHLYLYAKSSELPPALKPHRGEDPRWDAAQGNAGKAPTLAGLAGTWAEDPGYATKIVRHLNDLEPSFRKEQPMSLNFDPALVPFPKHRFKLATAKVEGVGMNRLGSRQNQGIVFHRALSGNQRFDDAVDWLRHPAVEGLTDGYIDHRTGEMVLINPMKAMFPSEVPESWADMAGWANGRYRNAEASADGRAFVAKHGGRFGASAINQDLESMEITGNYGTPISDACKTMLVQWAASRAQFHKIPWDRFPIKPADGLTIMYGHVEFCGAREKICPGPVVWDFMTGELIQRVRDALRAAQLEGKEFNPTGGGHGFQVNDPVSVSGHYNLRRSPTVTQDNIVAVLSPGTRATIIDGPRSADGHTWWDIKGEFGSGWIAESGLNRVAPQADARALSPHEDVGLPYPPGMDGEIASRLFGKVSGEEGTSYAFSPDDDLSRTWLEVGVKRHSFPGLQEVWDNGDGEEYFVFADGMVIWRAAEGESLRVLGAAPN